MTGFWSMLDLRQSREESEVMGAVTAQFGLQTGRVSADAISLLTKLQTSLDAGVLITIFHQHLSGMMNISGACYRDPEGEMLMLGDRAASCVRYRLALDGISLGDISLWRMRPITLAELEQIEVLISALLYPVRNARLLQAAKREASHDALTGLANRHALTAVLAREMARAQRTQESLAVIMADIDHFKSINDRFGHGAGDEVLRRVAGCLAETIREADVACRYGGEEFLLVLPMADSACAQLVAERIRHGLSLLDFSDIDSALRVSMSFGVSTLMGEEEASQLLMRADTALYAAKSAGRDCVRLSVVEHGPTRLIA